MTYNFGSQGWGRPDNINISSTTPLLPYNSSYHALNSLIRVYGIDGARQYPMSPNTTLPLFDGNDDFLYVKSCDTNGICHIRIFKMEEVDGVSPGSFDSVTREEFEQLKEMVRNVEQSISESAADEKQSRGRKSSGRDSGNS